MNKQIITFLTAALIFAVLPLTMAAASPADVVGRDVADNGIEKTLSGTLKSEDGEWYLVSGGATYEVHLGRIGNDLNGGLKDGNAATINGFVLDNHIAPITVESAGKTLAVWTKDRIPSWAGNGDRKNEVTGNERFDRGSMNDNRGYRNR
ncbi:MAG: hypothetical protein JW904_11365 [Spirochaetales bacterium]|nr:hypothetical protein [Spirochaetales bacterium]